MGIAFCDNHSDSGIVWICFHIKEKVESKLIDNLQVNYQVNHEFDSVTVVRFTFLSGLPVLAYCDVCAQKYKLPVIKISQVNLLLFHLKGLLSLKNNLFGECIECFYEQIFDIEVGKSDQLPFLNTTQKI